LEVGYPGRPLRSLVAAQLVDGPAGEVFGLDAAVFDVAGVNERSRTRSPRRKDRNAERADEHPLVHPPLPLSDTAVSRRVGNLLRQLEPSLLPRCRIHRNPVEAPTGIEPVEDLLRQLEPNLLLFEAKA